MKKDTSYHDFGKQFRIRARAIIIHDGKLLIVKLRKNDDFYCLPGGHLEYGESIKECMNREIIEELGISPQIGRLLYINNFIEETEQSMEFFFEATNAPDFLDTQKLEKSHAFEIFEIRWITKDENVNILPEKIAEDFKNGEILSDTVRFIK
ncbi:MAG TPA: NUDIX domain-containing protein [Candidatus Paceibacterota bacterium]|jgi:8-oxo-dGTP diphosphatase|nr:NUDIX domain-containing protein [Candidatus Paceibacterota bacterium]